MPSERSLSLPLDYLPAPSGGTIPTVEFCASNVLTTTVSIVGASNATSYTWSLPVGVFGGISTTSSITVGSTIPGQYTITATPDYTVTAAAYTCPGTPVTGILNVDAPPTASATGATSDAVCGNTASYQVG